MLRVLYLLIFYICGCNYQWVPSHDGNLAGSRSIYIEPIISHTSHKLRVQPIWQSINRQFAKEPSVILRSKETASYIVRVIIKDSQLRPSIPNLEPKANALKKKAKSYSTEERLNLKLHFIVWNKKTEKIDFQKTYADSVQYKSVLHNSPNSLRYTHYLDNRKHFTRQLAAKSTQKIINDYFN